MASAIPIDQIKSGDEDVPSKNAEEKRRRFLDTAKSRTQKALRAVRVLGNCANPSLYDYKPEEAEKIISALEEALTELKEKFRAKDDRRPEDEFDF